MLLNNVDRENGCKGLKCIWCFLVNTKRVVYRHDLVGRDDTGIANDNNLCTVRVMTTKSLAYFFAKMQAL